MVILTIMSVFLFWMLILWVSLLMRNNRRLERRIKVLEEKHKLLNTRHQYTETNVNRLTQETNMQFEFIFITLVNCGILKPINPKDNLDNPEIRNSVIQQLQKIWDNDQNPPTKNP